MENDDLNLEKALENDEDLLDFDLDDITDEALEESVEEPEDDIIELVNLVEKGPGVESSGDDEIADLLDEDEAPQEETGESLDLTDETASGQPVEDEDVDLDDLSLSEPGDEETGPEAGLFVEGAAEDELSDLLEEEPEEEPMTDLQEEAESADREITEDELEGMLEGEPGEEISLDLDSDEEELGDELADLLGEEPEGEDGFDLDSGETPETEVKPGEEEIPEEDVDGLLEEDLAEEAAADLDMGEGPEAGEGAAEDVTGGEFEGAPEQEPSEEMDEYLESMPKIAGQSPEKAPGVSMEADEIRAAMGEVPELEGVTPEPAVVEGTGISEEKLEEIVTRVVERVVEDVVERVTRETMAGVAEKVITEAIEALKQSLESTPE